MSAGWATLGVLLLAGASVVSPADPPRPGRHVVEIREMAFRPAVTEVQPGDTVVWINRDIVPHTATETGGSGWTTGPLGRGGSGRWVAGQRGETPYFCELHPTMEGKLIVR